MCYLLTDFLWLWFSPWGWWVCHNWAGVPWSLVARAMSCILWYQGHHVLQWKVGIFCSWMSEMLQVSYTVQSTSLLVWRGCSTSWMPPCVHCIYWCGCYCNLGGHSSFVYIVAPPRSHMRSLMRGRGYWLWMVYSSLASMNMYSVRVSDVGAQGGVSVGSQNCRADA